MLSFLLKPCILHNIQGVQEKFCFHYPLQPVPHLHIVARDFQSSQRNASVVSPIGWSIWPISVQRIAAQCLRGRGCKIIRILGKFFFTLQIPILICNCTKVQWYMRQGWLRLPSLENGRSKLLWTRIKL